MNRKMTRTITLLGLAAALSGAPGLSGRLAAAVAAAQQSAGPQSLDDQLARAVAEGNLVRTGALLDRGANLNSTLHNHKAAGTVLHAAALDGRTDLVKCLLDHGAEPVRHNSQFETPRTLAERAGHTAIADLLRQAEEGTYKRPTARPVPSPPTLTAKTAKSCTVAKRVAKNSKTKRPSSAAERQAAAYKRFKDYNYAKQNFGLGGTTYRANKW
jgi:hypothetical protein